MATFKTDLEGAPPQFREGPFEMEVVQEGPIVRLVGYGGSGRESVLKLTGNPNVARMDREWKTALAGAVGLNKETLIVFLREGRLYLTQRLTILVTTEELVTHSVSNTIGIADRVK